MKILTITDDCPPFALGGSGRIAWETSMGLAKRGHEVHLLTAAQRHIGVSRRINSPANMQIHLLPELPKRFAHYRSVFSRKREEEVLRVIEEVQPDLIHAHGLAWHMGYRWIKKAQEKSIPIIYTAHGVMHVSYGKVLPGGKVSWAADLRRSRWEWNPLRNILTKKYLKHCKKILCVSDALRQYLEQWHFENMQTLRNGIDLSFWKEMNQKEARVSLGIPEDQMVFLLAGRLGVDKGSEIIDRTLPEGTLLLAAGDIPEGTFSRCHTEHSRSVSQTFPALPHVRIFPHQNPEQMRLLYSAANVVLIPSLYLDPFPTVTLEAGACSRPVIATIFGGAKEAVRDGITGWIVNPRDEHAFREKLEWCAEHRMELPQFGLAARTHMEKHFSLEKHLDELLQIYATAPGVP
ncbi:MAG: glycosyltransferase family 4 protein [Patescibacteria group bacterium]